MLQIISKINKINKLMFYILAITVIILTVLVFYDVIGRYLLGKPTSFGYEMSAWLVATVTFLGGGYMVLTDQHIRVDLFYEKYSLRTKKVIGVITNLLGLLLVIAFIWYGGEQMINYFKNGAVGTTGFNIPLWIQWIVMPLGGILLGLQIIINIFIDLYEVITGNKISEELVESSE